MAETNRRTERSAGIIVFRERPSIVGEREFLLLDYGRYWDYPKGHLDPGENDQTAALRELKEETGLADVHLVPGFAHEIIYYFRHPSRGVIRKQVIFFLGATKATVARISIEHVGYAFLPLKEALGRLTYQNAKAVLKAAADHLATRSASGNDTMSS